MRVVAGFILSPLAPVLMLSAALFGPERFLRALPLVAIVTYILTVVMAVPVYCLLKSQDWLKLRHLLLAGAGVGLSLDILLYLFAFLTGAGGMHTLRQYGVDLIIEGSFTLAGLFWEAARLAYYAASGVLAGLLFWLIAIRTRPTEAGHVAL